MWVSGYDKPIYCFGNKPSFLPECLEDVDKVQKKVSLKASREC